MTRHVRATHVLNVINYVKAKKGVLGLDNLWEKMEEKRPGIDKEYSEKEFVEYELLQDFFAAIEELFGSDLNDIPRTREVGRHIAQNLGHFEYLTRAKGLKELIHKAEDNWDKVYDFGKIELAEWDEDSNKAIIRYHDFPKDENVCNYFLGSLEKDMEMLKLGGEIEHTDCPREGADYIEFTLTW